MGISLVPFPGEDDKNHVALKALFTLPETYPDVIPIIGFEVVKGIKPEQVDSLLSKVTQEASV